MSSFEEEYLKRRQEEEEKKKKEKEQKAILEKQRQDRFAEAYLALREKTEQPERYEAKEKTKALTTLDKLKEDYNNQWGAYYTAKNTGSFGGNALQNQRAIDLFEGTQQAKLDLDATITEGEKYYWAQAKMILEAYKDPDFQKIAESGAKMEGSLLNPQKPTGKENNYQNRPKNNGWSLEESGLDQPESTIDLENLSEKSRNETEAAKETNQNTLLQVMTAEQKQLYFYFYAKDQKDGTDLAERFMYFLEEELNQKTGSIIAEKYKNNPIGAIVYGAVSGLDQFAGGLKSWANNIIGAAANYDDETNYTPQKVTQAAAGIMREDLQDVGIPWYNFATGKWESVLGDVDIFGNSLSQIAYDTTNTFANMAPSILVSTMVGLVNNKVGAVAGGALLGASAAGNAYEQKILEGWKPTEARSYANMIGFSEAALEAVLGVAGNAAGVGSKGLLSKFGQKAVAKVDNVIAKVAKSAGGKLAASAFGEGLEEGIQSILEPYFARIAAGKELPVNWEEVLYSSLLGALMGFGFGAANVNTYVGNVAITSNSRLTSSEKAVLKSETAVRIKEQQEKLGRELTEKEKTDIEKKVRADLEKGYVSTDRIEEVLGGESWKKYREAYNREQSVLKDLEGLYEGEELERQRQAIRDNSVLAGMREELSRGVSESVKGDRFLHESYLEKGRQTERFTADVSKYKGKQAQIVQKAIDSGVLNNTNRAHELVDLIAKIGADKDIDFDFVNNEKLKESGFALDGVTVNGYVGANGIAINISSQKALNSVVGHEITHVLEGTKLYNELAEWVKAYANIKEKDGYNNRLKQLISIYQNVEGYKGAEGMAKIHQEAVADLVGDFLFTDPKFLQRLLQEKPNLFRKIWNEIKYLATVTSGTEDARRLAQLQRAFEKAYRSDSKSGFVDSFQISEPVEETKTLLAMHNLTETDLRSALDRGSLIMPSVAVAESANSKFGPITAVISKEAIDPAENSTNKLYGADAWTPNRNNLKKNPRFDTNKTETAIADIRNQLGTAADQLFDVTAREYMDAMTANTGSIYAAYAQNLGMKTAYALEAGLITEIPTKADGTVDTAKLKEELGKVLVNDTWGKYKKWLDSISDETVTSYDTATSEDILANMQAQPATAKPFRLTEDGKLTVPATEYAGLEDLRQNRGRLSQNADAAAEQTGQKMLQFAKGLGTDTAAAVKAINEGFGVRYDAKKIRESFSQNGVYLSNEQAQQLQALYKEAVELPTEYFEAKPGGKVDINQIGGFAVPVGTDPELIRELQDRGFDVREYDPNQEGSRAEVVNGFENMKFSLNQGTEATSQPATKKPTQAGGVKYSVTASMTEKQRYEALKNQKINVAGVQENAILDGFELEGKSLNDVYKFVKENKDALGLNKTYKKDEIQLEFEYSNRGIKKSIMQTAENKVDAREYLDVLSCLDQIIDSAVLIERHGDKSGKENSQLKQVCVLISAFWKNGVITPVQLEIKETVGSDNQLYLAVAIKKSGVNVTASAEAASVTRPDSISVQELIKKINPNAKDFLKYIPDQFLSTEQTEGKREGVKKDIEKYPNSPFKQLSISENESKQQANGWQIKGEDVLLQQEADANGLVWENGVPFRKDLLELARKRQSGEFSIAPPVPESAKTETAKSQAAANIAPPVPGTETDSTVAAETESKVNPKEDAWEGSAPFEVEEETQTPTTVRERTGAKLANMRTELAENQRHRQELSQKFDEEIAKLQERYNGLKNKDTKEAQKLLRQIERQKRLKKDRDAEYAKRISDIEGRVEKLQDFLRQDLTREELVDRQIRKVDEQLENDRAALEEEFAKRREALEAATKDKDTFIKEQAMSLYRELQGLKKGVKASDDLSYLLDQGYTWNAVKTALLGIHENPGKNLIPKFQLGTMAREMLDQNYENRVYELNDLDAEYLKKLDRLENEAAQKRSAIRTADQRKAKQQQYTEQMEQLVGDTSTWKDKKMGISYRVNTLRRNLRDVVRDAKGNRDIAKADAIYDELQGKYNQHEAQLKRESTEIKSKYADLNITKAEDKYIQMLGELLYNPDTELSEATVQEYLEKHKKQIDEKKVDKVIEMARADYDSLLQRVNEVLREQGMKTIPYRKGYFPHFTEDKQGILGKIFNWKTKDNEIPTDIAGLTEQFSPNRSWQSFNKERTSDTTTYSFLQGMDSYVQGSLDWIYHIEDIQKRRALENYIRYIHSEKGIQERIDAVKSSTELDADEVQEQIDNILKEAKNPLGNFVQDLRTGTNTLAGKKSSLDRGVEGATNRKIYSVMTNLSSRVSANMVAGSISSALTNFIPITQSWGQVSPLSSLVAMGDTIKATIRDDGIVNKSDFLTNRLRNPDKLYQGFWDKASEKAGFLMEAIDSFTSQTVWRSKYRENLASGMSESEAIKNADQFAENVLAGRSRGNMPTLFDAKNPISKMFTAFQLEVNNQYGYMFKDLPQDVKNKSVGRLVAGYAGIFLGAYAYNALYSMLTGRNAAFDPIRIVEDLVRDLGDDDDEPLDDVLGFAEDVLQEVPFIGGLLGGGRVPLSSAIPYDGDIMKAIEGGGKLAQGDWGELTSEWLKPLYYMVAPMGGGQLKKSIGGAAMYINDKEIKGSYTDSGNLRFPVENDFWSVVQAITMGQWSGENAREYFDEGRKPLTPKQMQEFMDSGMSIHDYWEYRDGLSGLRTMEEKAEYINGLDLTTEQKNILINNIADRDEKIDMSEYGNYGSLAEYDFAKRYPEKYRFFKDNDISYSDYEAADETGKRAYTWAYENPGKYAVSKVITDDFMEFYNYKSDLDDIKGDKDVYGYTISGSAKKNKWEYINSLDLPLGKKWILFKMQYPKDKSYDDQIVKYMRARRDISSSQRAEFFEELGIEP